MKNVLFLSPQMRYLVFEDTVVDKVVGSVATEGYVTLSKRELHSWIGLRLSNVSINSLAKNAFNLTHKVKKYIYIYNNHPL